MNARRHSWDLLMVIALALLGLVVATVSRGFNPALSAVTLPLVLFLPGYALVALLLPSGHLGFPERVALSLGVSIALTVIAGLLLHALRIPLVAASWRVLLSALTLAFAGSALVRRAQGRVAPPGALAARIEPREAVVLSAGAILIGLALGLGGIGAAEPRGEAFTEFWAMGEQTETRAVVRVGLRNEEGRPVTYRVALQAGDHLLAEWPRVTVREGGAWEAMAGVPAALLDQEVSARVYRSDVADDEPYRYARVTIEKSDGP